MRRELSIGKGLFEAAKEEQLLDQVQQELKTLKECFESNPEFLDTLCSPFLSGQDRSKILKAVLSGTTHTLILSAMEILYEQKRQCSFEVFYQSFLKEYEQERGILQVKVYSASPLGEEEKNLLKISLEKKTGKQIMLQCFLDQALIGGLKYEYNNKVFDGGVTGNLLRLKEEITADAIAGKDKGGDEPWTLR